MTAGQEALVEAMRVEQARIYGQLCPEHHAGEDENPRPKKSLFNVTVLAPPREDVA